MKEIRYKSFSLKTHKKNWALEKPNACQFELTFKCGLHCRHCYTDCYNKPAYLKKELNTGEVKCILDKLYKSGVIWICFTGGDPLARSDFPDVYSYARKKGFIITLFTSGYFLNKGLVGYFKQNPPFVIEMTLNAASGELYEKISRVKGSFKKAIEAIGLMLEMRLPLKIKTQVTRDNFGELPRIRNFIRGLGLKFLPSFDMHAGLDRGLGPCNLRVSPEEILAPDLNKSRSNTCQLSTGDRNQRAENDLFRCAIGTDGVHIDPYGNTFPCNLIREPAFNLLDVGLKQALDKLLASIKKRKFLTASKCKNCRLRSVCRWCPGKAYLENGGIEAPIDYYCKLAGYSSGAIVR